MEMASGHQRWGSPQESAQCPSEQPCYLRCSPTFRGTEQATTMSEPTSWHPNKGIPHLIIFPGERTDRVASEGRMVHVTMGTLSVAGDGSVNARYDGAGRWLPRPPHADA